MLFPGGVSKRILGYINADFVTRKIQKVMYSDFNFHRIYMDFFASLRNVLSLGAIPSAIQDRVNRIVGQSVVGLALCFFCTTISVMYITE